MSGSTWTRRFETAARRWQRDLGLTDWSVRYRTKSTHDENLADISRDGDARIAIVTAYANAGGFPAERIALHEMLHLALADLLRVAAKRGADHNDTVLEEHRLIERLLAVIPERRG